DAAALNPLRLTYPCSAYVGGAGVVVVAVRGARTGPTAIDRRPLAAVVGAARVGGAGIGVAAVGSGGAGRAAGHRLVAAEAAVARVRRAGVCVGAGGGARARLANRACRAG